MIYIKKYKSYFHHRTSFMASFSQFKNFRKCDPFLLTSASPVEPYLSSLQQQWNFKPLVIPNNGTNLANKTKIKETHTRTQQRTFACRTHNSPQPLPLHNSHQVMSTLRRNCLIGTPTWNVRNVRGVVVTPQQLLQPPPPSSLTISASFPNHTVYS